ncbi:MAG: acetyl-CoA carboxylase biotin carboxyl carrier protein subunit [Polyangiales bacterium]
MEARASILSDSELARLPGVLRVLRLGPSAFLLFHADGRRTRASRDAHGKLWLDVEQTGSATRRFGPLEPGGGAGPGARASGESSDGTVKAKTAGTVARLLVAVGDVVTKGQPLLVVELMKMELEIAAPTAGTVIALPVAAGEPVSKGGLLARIG